MLHDRIPRCDVIHQLPDGVRAGNGMLRGLLGGDTFEQRFKRRAVPGIAAEGAVHLINDSFNFAHERLPGKA